jgi:O-antigen/teichoic acid export membrane protein
MSFCLIITIIVTNFFGTSGNKFLAEFRGRENAKSFILVLKILIYAPIITLLIISVFIYLNWQFISDYFGLPLDMLIPILLFIYFRSSYIIIRRIFYGVGLVKDYTQNEIISDILMFCVLGYICLSGQKHFLLNCYIISYSFFSILSILILYKKIPKVLKRLKSNDTIDKKIVSLEFFRYGFVSMIGTVASTGTGYLSLLIIGTYLSNSQAGVYSSVITIISILMFIPKLATQVLLPEFSKLFGQNDNDQITKLLFYSLKVLISIAFLVCFLVFFFSNNILSLFGPDFQTGNIILRIMLPSVFIRIVSIPFISFLSGTKYIIYPNIGGIIILIISVLLWILLVPDYKLIGIAIGYTSGILVGIGYQIYVAIIKMKIR